MLTGYGLKVITEYKLLGYSYRYDFFLPELNLLIEYDGAQHYKAIPFWGGVEGLKKMQQSDKEKDHLATLYNHRLIRIPYTVIEDIETYLPRVLMQHIKYKRDNLYFRNFLTFSKHYNLQGDATPKEYEQYIFTPSITI